MGGNRLAHPWLPPPQGSRRVSGLYTALHQRGLVAIDPAPCLGDDIAFEAIDLVLWQADDVDMIASRAKLLAPAIGADSGHLIEWCSAFAAMTALELAESPNASSDRVQAYLALAAQAPEKTTRTS